MELLEAKNVNGGESILRRREYLLWSGRALGDQREPKTIPGNGQSQLCNLAIWNAQHQKAIFTLVEGPPQLPPEGEYSLTIQVTGKWQGHRIREVEQFFLRYQNPIIQLGNSVVDLGNDKLEKKEIKEPEKENQRTNRIKRQPQKEAKKKLSKRGANNTATA